jgi:hypothetical protein
MKCIICRQEKDESDEHIIPEALGNKKLITKRVCEKCNNKLGTNVDDYLTNHPIVKLIRTNEKLYGKSGKDIKFFSGVEVDERTGLKYDMKSEKPVLQSRIISGNDGYIRIEAANVQAGFDHFKNVMKRKGYSEEQIDKLCKEAIIGEKEVIAPPEFKKDASIDFSRLGLSAIKIAYEYSFTVLGEKYLDDEASILFSRELKKTAYSKKKNIVISNELARYVTFPIHGSGIEKFLSEIRDILAKTNMDILHTISMIKQDGCLYCVLNLCMTDVISFVIKITEKADDYDIQLPFTFVIRDGTVFTI